MSRIWILQQRDYTWKPQQHFHSIHLASLSPAKLLRRCVHLVTMVARHTAQQKEVRTVTFFVDKFLLCILSDVLENYLYIIYRGFVDPSANKSLLSQFSKTRLP